MPELNPEQKRAVETTEGPLLVLAGAGAGKTRVIAHRILEIVKKKKVPPEQILAITFTNKAASEMRERVMHILSSELASPVNDKVWPRRGYPDPGVPFVSTFHSLGLQIIKENYRLMGFKRTPAIYDRSDSMREIKAALKDIDGDFEARSVLSAISKHKGDGLVASEFSESATEFRDSVVARVWQRYDEKLAKDHALDFDDLLLRATRFLEQHEAARAHYQARWKYIHIDEYQDTNGIQARMAGLLVGPERNICVVGDIDQTIYGWRGAQIENIIQFERRYPGASVVMLEQNYRSTQNILSAANDIIKKNTGRPEKNLFTKGAEGELLSVYPAFDEADEANFIARIIREGLENGRQPRDFAVLYRANFQSRAVEEALLRSNIDYQVLGTRFFDRKEVKDALAFVRAAVYETPADLGRVMDTLPGIGKTTKLKVLENKEHELRGTFAEKINGMRALLARIRDAAAKRAPSELMRFVISESGLEATLKADKVEDVERLENLKELVSLAARYDLTPQGNVGEDPLAESAQNGEAESRVQSGLEAFLESVALVSDQDSLKEEQNAVRLMTIHASKGLEFPIVFITGLEEGLFPMSRDDDESDQEEERRLMYVAVTRAREKVYLTYASYRTIFGARSMTTYSQFLDDIPDELKENAAPERLGKTIYLE